MRDVVRGISAESIHGNVITVNVSDLWIICEADLDSGIKISIMKIKWTFLKRRRNFALDSETESLSLCFRMQNCIGSILLHTLRGF